MCIRDRYVDIVKSDLGAQTNGGTPKVTIKSLHASAVHLDPPGYIRFASSSYVNAASKIDKRVDNLNIMTKYRHLRLKRTVAYNSREHYRIINSAKTRKFVATLPNYTDI